MKKNILFFVFVVSLLGVFSCTKKDEDGNGLGTNTENYVRYKEDGTQFNFTEVTDIPLCSYVDSTNGWTYIALAVEDPATESLSSFYFVLPTNSILGSHPASDEAFMLSQVFDNGTVVYTTMTTGNISISSFERVTTEVFTGWKTGFARISGSFTGTADRVDFQGNQSTVSITDGSFKVDYK